MLSYCPMTRETDRRCWLNANGYKSGEMTA